MRKSNIELLRLFAMFLVVLSHYNVHTAWPDSIGMGFRCMINMGSLGEVGVCIFLLITGYFSFKSTITISSLAKTAFQIWFYSILCLVIAHLLKIEINPGAFSLFPIISGTYWFASTYVGLYLSIPLINIIIRNVTRRAHLHAQPSLGSVC